MIVLKTGGGVGRDGMTCNNVSVIFVVHVAAGTFAVGLWNFVTKAERGI